MDKNARHMVRFFTVKKALYSSYIEGSKAQSIILWSLIFLPFRLERSYLTSFRGVHRDKTLTVQVALKNFKKDVRHKSLL